MKVKIFDTAVNNKPGTCYFDLKKEIEQLQEKYEIKDIKTIMTYPDRLNVIVAIFYEEPSVIQEDSFTTRFNGKEINKFLATHDVIKIDHNSIGDEEIVTTITYRKKQEQ